MRGRSRCASGAHLGLGGAGVAISERRRAAESDEVSKFEEFPRNVLKFSRRRSQSRSPRCTTFSLLFGGSSGSVAWERRMDIRGKRRVSRRTLQLCILPRRQEVRGGAQRPEPALRNSTAHQRVQRDAPPRQRARSRPLDPSSTSELWLASRPTCARRSALLQAQPIARRPPAGTRPSRAFVRTRASMSWCSAPPCRRAAGRWSRRCTSDAPPTTTARSSPACVSPSTAGRERWRTSSRGCCSRRSAAM